MEFKVQEYIEYQENFAEYLLGSDAAQAITWTQKTIAAGVLAVDFFNKIFTPAMAAVGARFGKLEIFLPELMDAADIAKAVSDEVLQPIFSQDGSGQGGAIGKAIICSVQGDLHDIGKNMVALMLQVNGFDVIDMGVNVSPRDILSRALEIKTDIVGLSSLMTTSMPYMKECIEMRDGMGHKDAFTVIVGGAPITAEYAAGVGADAFGSDAVDAVEKCKALLDR
jgi:methylmalonyl-CoA mutase cobalamin-binding domain/chain